MNRPLWWKYDSAGDYLYDQYKYLRAVKKVQAKDVIEELGFTNRSSLFNLFKGHVYIRIDEIDLYKTLFHFNEEEIKYLRLLTVRARAHSEYEIKTWNEEIEHFKNKYLREVPIKMDSSEIFNMWDSFKNNTKLQLIQIQ